VAATLLTLINTAALFAAEDAPAPGGGGGIDQLLVSMLPFVAIFVLFYFLLIRPQRREQSRRQEMLAEVKKNDRVLTAGGIFGVVTNVRREADEVTIKVDEATNTKLRMTLSSVSRVLGDEPAEDTTNK
jgi:preprotein translocase subunit YajC